MKSLFLSAGFIILVQIVSAQNILKRKPYLNKATQSGVNILFRSQEPCAAWLKVYNNETDTILIEEAVADTNHNILFDQGVANATYKYQCGCDTLAFTPLDSTYFFKTLPEDDFQGPINIWAIGDFGTGGQQQLDVYNAYTKYTDSLNITTDVLLMLGDNAYGDGTDDEYQVKNFDVYHEILKNSVVWPVPGNHDYKSVDIVTHNGPYYDIYDLPTQGESGGLPSLTEKYYSFDVGNVHFVCLNSEWSPWIYVPVASPMALWLTADLAATDKTFKVVLFHQPPYSKGSHDSDDPFGIMNMFRQNIIPLVEAGGADLVLAGHSHGYERSYLINGHYLYSSMYNENLNLIDGGSGSLAKGEAYYKKKDGNLLENRGTVYNVVGSSGKLSEGGSMDHPVMYYNNNVSCGSAVIQVNGDTLTSKFLTENGLVMDEFSIIKNETGEPGNNPTSINSKQKVYETKLNLRKEYSINWLELSSEKVNEAYLNIYNLEGKLVLKLLDKSVLGRGIRKYDLSTLQNGTYIAEFVHNKQQTTLKFILN